MTGAPAKVRVHGVFSCAMELTGCVAAWLMVTLLFGGVGELADLYDEQASETTVNNEAVTSDGFMFDMMP